MNDIFGALFNIGFLLALVAVIFFIWTGFYRLAQNNNKVKWLFGLLGVITFFIGVNIGIVTENFLGDFILSGLIRLPFGLLASFGLYKFLKTKWTR